MGYLPDINKLDIIPVYRYNADMYSVEEAAKVLGLDPSQVRRLLRSGEVKGKKLARDWVVLELNYTRKRRPKRRKLMKNTKETKHIKISTTAVTKGHSGTGPVAEGATLPQMQPHIIVKLEGDEVDIYAEMSFDVARNLKELLSLNLK